MNAHDSVRVYAGSTGKQPYAEIQEDVENHLDRFLGKQAYQVRNIVIVGGYLGFEIDRFLINYPKVSVSVFEPSPRYYGRLVARFAGNKRVRCFNYAVADVEGEAEFHELSIEGAGSLLPMKSCMDEDTWIAAGARPAERYEVKVVTLDRFEPLAGLDIDLLWCDVQGAELSVLKGAEQTLTRSKALFLEIATTKTMYEGQCLLSELEEYLDPRGFSLVGMGLCLETGNGTGNGLWLRKELQRVPSGSRAT